jgi:hypothetical protein
MDLSKILSIAGKPGLFKMVGEAKNNIVVESLIDGKKMPAFSHDRISTLKEISIFTEDDDVSLREVLKAIYEIQNQQLVPDPKKAKSVEIKSLFEKVLPNYNRETVYASDMIKIFGWYNLLLQKGMLDFTEEPVEEQKEENTEVEIKEEPALKKKSKKSIDKAEKN